MILITYTTLYRQGGPKFARVAKTMAKQLRSRHPAVEVRCVSVESKREFVDTLAEITRAQKCISALHFIGHSGMYGPMFRTTSMPEQFSPYEWRTLAIPFAAGAEATFHACRTARWFAPFFARVFNVRCHGYHGYTSISTQPHAFRWEGPLAAFKRFVDAKPLYVIACTGKKSHGVLGSIAKYSGLAEAEKLKSFEPMPEEGDSSYDGVAELYDRAFADISVRRDECRFIEGHLPQNARVLDVGCGNGALLAKLANKIATGVGVDASPKMIELARARNGDQRNLSFHSISGPRLPFANESFDVIVSLLSFRYLDWDPMMNELRRVLVPGGRILIVDMVTVPTRPREFPRLIRHKLRQLYHQRRRPEFARALSTLVADPRWHMMLKYNPIRSDHEFRWYLESRFPGRSPELLTLGYDTRVLGFDSGPLPSGVVAPQSYP